MTEIIKHYHVMMESRATVSQGSETVTVGYSSPTYSEAWTGARSVCRLGTNFDKPEQATRREFWKLDEAGDFTDEPFDIGPGIYTVRRIFVENTRKQGKRRMTMVDADTLLTVMEDNKIKASQKLKDLLSEVLNEAGGAKITVATARRLGIKTPETEMGDDEAETG